MTQYMTWEGWQAVQHPAGMYSLYAAEASFAQWNSLTFTIAQWEQHPHQPSKTRLPKTKNCLKAIVERSCAEERFYYLAQIVERMNMGAITVEDLPRQKVNSAKAWKHLKALATKD
ncbi:hypothetical protein ACQ4M3_07685 [Leptolyngbya sp. AN03gr2]|uniref:hypothetical protein n=1 Tax=unclassified Leptolyngbya TaxID=2650499 RepID=UPI003D323204